MNKARRKALLDVSSQIRSIAEELGVLCREEEEYRDNMPENLQGSERYEKTDEAAYCLEHALDSLSEATESIEEATQ
jgi:hypothetical protein